MYARDMKKLLLLAVTLSIFLIAAVGCTPANYRGVFVNMDSVGVTADGVDYDKNDILFLPTGDVISPTVDYLSNWATVFDGEMYGLNDTKHDISAFSFNEMTFDFGQIVNQDLSEELYLSFAANRARVPGIPGWVYGQDIVKFTQGAEVTANDVDYEYEMFFDGSDVGLTTMGEKVDGISVWPPEYYEVIPADVVLPADCHAAVIFLSTRGRYRVNDNQGGFLVGDGSDVLAFCAVNVGQDTAGFWFRVFDGSEANIHPRNALTGLDVWGVNLSDVVINADSGNYFGGINFLFTPRVPFSGTDVDGNTVSGGPSQLFGGGSVVGEQFVYGPVQDFNEDGDFPALNGVLDNVSVLDFEELSPP